MRSALVAITCLSTAACVMPGTIPTSPKPETTPVVVDFSNVLEGRKESHSVYFATSPGLLRRVAVSPNLVFEAARSTTAEVPTAGPEAAPAVGHPVPPWLSSALLRELKRIDATPIPTVALRGGEETCGPERCPPGSWVERVIERGRRPGAKGEQVDAPTAILAVRNLELSTVKLPVTVERAASGEILFKLEKKAGEPSLCGALSVELPALRFTAEVLSPVDGRFIARILEVQLTSAPKELARRPIAPVVWEAESVAREDSSGIASIQTRWKSRDVTCENAVAEFERIRTAAAAGLDRESVAREVIARGLAPLVLPAR